MKLIDTDIFIDFLRGSKEALNFIKKESEISFSAITEAELLSGNACNNPREMEKVIHLLAQFEKVPAGNPLVQVAGNLRRVYGLELPDAIIAASAIVTNSVLITRNIKDFKDVKELKFEKPY